LRGFGEILLIPLILATPCFDYHPRLHPIPDHKSQLGFSWYVELTSSLGFPTHADFIALGGTVFFQILFGAFKNQLTLRFLSLSQDYSTHDIGSANDEERSYRQSMLVSVPREVKRNSIAHWS